MNNKRPKLLIATSNPGKLHEISAIFSNLNINLISPNDIDLNINVAEAGSSYLENARIKALAYQAATGLPVLADDSGLEVEPLDGAPGIYSARFSPRDNATDSDRRQYLLAQLENKPHPWTAQFHCTAVLALPNDEIIVTTGTCKGVIAPEERGTRGFGYDPVFFIPSYQATMAELSAEIKNKISHRAKAMAAMIPHIQKKLLQA
jgi:XTP/dITP diphosphohydrolase